MPEKSEFPVRLQLPDGLDAAGFLTRYWQKKPLLMRGALQRFEAPLSPDELAGLACEADVESRLVTRFSLNDLKQLEGPFEPEDFAGLPETGWTLLVQDVEKHLPALASLCEAFDFLPAWRRDDLMVSYAAPGGTVGAHIDAYDVFLIQGHGRRRWEIDHAPADLSVRPDCDLPLLNRFEGRESFTLAPGDALYLPPGVAHYGVADEPTTTWSVGFRAPDRANLLQACGLPETEGANERYADPDLAPGEARNGEISQRALARAQELIGAPGPDTAILIRAFGVIATELKPWLRPEPAEEEWSTEDVSSVLGQDGFLQRHGFSRFAQFRDADGLWLFFDGACMRLPTRLGPLADLLCVQKSIHLGDPGIDGSDPDALAVLCEILRAGSLSVENCVAAKP